MLTIVWIQIPALAQDQQAFLVWMQCYRSTPVLLEEVVKGHKQCHCFPVVQNLFRNPTHASQLCAEPALS